MRRSLLAVFALLGCRSGDGTSAEEAEPTPPRVRCEAVGSATIADAVIMRGAVAPPPLAEAVVASPVMGRLSRLLVEEGDLVVANQLIAQVEDPTLGASVAQADAEVDAARVELRSATTERARSADLFAAGIVARKEVDDATAREDAAEANLRAVQARSELARRQLARTDLRAPRAGTVLRVFKRAGELLDAADTSIAEISDLSVLELRAQVTGAELIGVLPGTAASVELDALPGLQIVGEVVAVSPAMDPATSLGTVRVRLVLAAASRPAIGFTGVATIDRTPRQALVIPPGAVRRSIVGREEALVCAHGMIEVREIEIGARETGAVEIRAGLTAGEAIVVDHVLGLEDGVAIEAATTP